MKFKLSLVNGYEGTKERILLEQDGFKFGENYEGLLNDEIEINTLEELVTFTNKYGGSIILQKPFDFEEKDFLMEIEIYNDYRE